MRGKEPLLQLKLSFKKGASSITDKCRKEAECFF
jgi:hypothetical protein